MFFLFNKINSRKHVIVLVVLIFLMGISGCSETSDSIATPTLFTATVNPTSPVFTRTPLPPTQDPSIELQNAIDRIDTFPDITMVDSVVGKEITTEFPNYTNADNTTCTTRDSQFSDNFGSFNAFGNPNESILWPGAIIQGGTLAGGDFIPIRSDRASGTITLIIPINGEELPSSIRIENPDQGKIQDAIESLLPEVLNPPADILYHSSFVQSQKQANLFLARELGIGLFENTNIMGAIGESIDLDFDIGVQGGFDYSKSKNHALIAFRQKYYTISFDPDEVGASMFENYNSETMLKSIGSDNPPVYVSSIDYGRLVVAVVSSDESLLNLAAALSSRLNQTIAIESLPGNSEMDTGAIISASEAITLEAEFESFLNTLDVKIIAIGGPADSPNEIITTNGLDLTNYLKNGGTVSKESQGVPLNYTFRYLKDDDVVKLPLQVNYGSYSCVTTEIKEIITVSLDKVCVQSASKDNPEVDFDFNVRFDNQDESIYKNGDWITITPSGDCNRSLEINELESKITFPFTPEDGACFNIFGTFIYNGWPRNPDTKIDIPYCYQDGVLSPDFGANQKVFSIGNEIDFRIFWNVENSTP